FVTPLSPLLFFLDFLSVPPSLLASSLIFTLITEALNTAVEYTVDLVTDEWHEFAKKAKDTASAAVFFSLVQAAVIWGINLFLS
ncbi:diacylglycerol kinase, partial [Caminibacter pacificus]